MHVYNPSAEEVGKEGSVSLAGAGLTSELWVQ